jgi:hypothetical protein
MRFRSHQVLEPGTGATLGFVASTAQQLKDQRNNCEHQQNVYKPAQRMAANQTQQPQHQEDDKQRPQHRAIPERLSDVTMRCRNSPVAQIRKLRNVQLA